MLCEKCSNGDVDWIKRINSTVVVDPCPNSFGVYIIKWIGATFTNGADRRKISKNPLLVLGRGNYSLAASICGPLPAKINPGAHDPVRIGCAWSDEQTRDHHHPWQKGSHEAQ